MPPIFCDECSVLALAELDDRLLCADCLLAALVDCPPGEIASRVRPLVLGEARASFARPGNHPA